jgi:hypothetical protein
MTTCVNIVNKRCEDLLHICKACKQSFECINYQQWFCENSKCKTMRHTAYQRTYRQRRRTQL